MSKLQVDTSVPNEIKMTRAFDAPRRLVMKAMMTPELIKRWQGGVRSTMLSVDVDARVGGTYRYAFRANNGYEFAFSGVYREVSEDRVVHTERFNDDPNEALVTTTFVEHDGATTLTIVIAFPSPEMRDAVLATGMADGAGESYDMLDELLATL